MVRKHSKPITPAQRLLDHPDMPQDVKEKLSAQKNAQSIYNQKQIQLKLKAVFKLLR